MENTVLLSKDDLQDVNKVLDFGIVENEYYHIYRYTIIKSLLVVTSLDFNDIAKNNLDTLIQYSPIFDSIYMDGIAARIIKEKKLDFLLKDNIDNLTKLSINEKVKDILQLWKHDTLDTNYKKYVKKAFLSAYNILQMIILVKLNRVYECKEITDVKTYLEDIKALPMFLPVEQECTVSYFLYRYFKNYPSSKWALGSDNMENVSNSKKEFYEYILKDDNSDRMVSEVYTYAKKVLKRKRDMLMKEQLIAGEDLLSDDDDIDKLIAFLQQCTDTVRFKEYISAPSTETIPYLGHSVLVEITALLLGEFYKEVPLREIYRLQGETMEGIFQLYETQKKLTDVAFDIRSNHFDKKAMSTLISDLGIVNDKILEKDVVNHTIIPNKGTVFSNVRSIFALVIQSIYLLKLRSYLYQEEKVLEYIAVNRECFKTSLPGMNRTETSSVIYFNKPLSKQVVRISKHGEEKVVSELFKQDLGLDDKMIEEFHASATKIYRSLMGDVEFVDVTDYCACYQLLVNIKTQNFTLYDYSHYYKRKVLHKEKYNYTPQKSYRLQTIIANEVLTTEERYLFEKLINAQKSIIVGFDLISVYEQLGCIIGSINSYFSCTSEEWFSSPVSITNAILIIIEYATFMSFGIVDGYFDYVKSFNKMKK